MDLESLVAFHCKSESDCRQQETQKHRIYISLLVTDVVTGVFLSFSQLNRLLLTTHSPLVSPARHHYTTAALPGCREPPPARR